MQHVHVNTAEQQGAAGWQARLSLSLQRRAGRSVLASRSHYGPLRIQRPFYPEGDDLCHLYVLHPPGGVVGGDELLIDVDVETNARALLTTPAAGKFYRSVGAVARQTQRLHVATGATLEWLPQETIIFDGARTELRTRIELAADAGFIGWEILCLGRPGAGETFQHGRVRQRFELWREGMPLYLEHACYEEEAAVLSAAWGLAGLVVSGTMLCAVAAAECIEELRGTARARAGLFSVTQLDGVLVCRYLGAHAEEARQCFEQAWQLLRPSVMNRCACAPRIWAT